MNDTLLTVKKRIKTVTSIRKITKAMKLIAQSRFNKLKTIYDANTSYIISMSRAVNILLKSIDISNNDLYLVNPNLLPTCLNKYSNSNRKLYIYVSSTLGLSGSYYYNLDKEAKKLLTKDVDCIFIGEKGFKHYKDKVNKYYDDFLYLLSDLDYDTVNYFRHYLDKIYRENEYSSIEVIYTHFVNSMSFEVKVTTLLPLDLKETEDRIINIKGINKDLVVKEEDIEKLYKEPIFEGDVKREVDLIVPHYLDALLFRIMLSSSLSEETSRKNSMENATSSADKLIHDLNLKRNKLRQTKITNEITEIVSSNNEDIIY